MTATSRAALVGVLTAALLAGCASSPGPVSLSADWPTQPGDFDDVTDAWTRHGRVTAPFRDRLSTVFEVYATLKSPEWQAAYARYLAEQQDLPSDAQARVAADLKAEAAKHYELELLFRADDRRADNLHRKKRSSWRVALVDAAGTEIEPLEIVRDRRPPSVIKNEFPNHTPFHTAYIVRFPRSGLDLFGPGKTRLALKVSNQRGGLELVWEAGAN